VVSRPPPIRPMAPPAMLIAAYHAERPGWRGRALGEGGGDQRQRGRGDPARPPAPCTARAVRQEGLAAGRNPPAREAAENSTSPAMKHLAAAEPVPRPGRRAAASPPEGPAA